MMQLKSRVKIVSEDTLSNGWTRLSSYLLDYIDSKGATQRLKREVYH
ncbi:ADP-ribose pyrophosphatase, partial [Rhizobium ruizarguesonis]